DWDTCAILAIIEFVLNCFAQAAMVLAVRSIASDKHLHGNFKFVLCLTLSRTFLNGMRRCVADYLTIFWTGEISPEFLEAYKDVSIFTNLLLCISMPFVAIERMLYTYNVANYEKRRTSRCSLACCAAIVIIISGGIACADSFVAPIALQFAAPTFTLVV
ncbi:hypothetical protein PMAYCL1PPCAC_15198, partial [Pristionchus mayeri]